MKINITTTLDIEEDVLNEDKLGEIYNEFREIIKTAYESRDLTDFSFINADTNTEIEDEVRQNEN